MPFRERARALFRSKPSGTPSPPDHDRYPSNVYRPDEPMPRPKYRMPPKKEHKEKLEAFNFADAWRKKSFQSNYSPMGTRAPSRRNSFLSRKSRPVSRTNSFTSESTDKSSTGPQARQREGLLHPVMTTQTENEGDDDVGNVGLSRVNSRERAAMMKSREMNGVVPHGVTAHDHHPFSEHELQMALQRSRLSVE